MPAWLHVSSPTLAQVEGGGIDIGQSILQRVLESWIIAGVLAVLIAMSVTCWFIIVYKAIYFRRVRGQSRQFIDAFWQSARLDAIYERAESLSLAPVSKVFKAGYLELSRVNESADKGGDRGEGFGNVERALRRAALSETMELERLVPFLATTGSAAPFIGLFGTVWGIMEAFAHIRGDANLLTSVAPHIAEALVATAIGLLAAIPAVIAYNFFVRKIRLSLAEMENFSAEFLNTVRRHFF